MAPESPPLAGIRVLDFTRYLAGPFASMLLADYGADVVKVESRKGREFRLPGAKRDSYFFLSSNRGKRSLRLDFKSQRGRELLYRILPRFDVVIENFRPGVMEELGLGPAFLTGRDPRLVYCSISGFGADGPYRDRPGFDQIAQGMSGFMSLTGTPESGPTRAGIAIGDLLGGTEVEHIAAPTGFADGDEAGEQEIGLSDADLGRVLHRDQRMLVAVNGVERGGDRHRPSVEDAVRLGEGDRISGSPAPAPHQRRAQEPRGEP